MRNGRKWREILDKKAVLFSRKGLLFWLVSLFIFGRSSYITYYFRNIWMFFSNYLSFLVQLSKNQPKSLPKCMNATKLFWEKDCFFVRYLSSFSVFVVHYSFRNMCFFYYLSFLVQLCENPPKSLQRCMNATKDLKQRSKYHYFIFSRSGVHFHKVMDSCKDLDKIACHIDVLNCNSFL